MAAGKILGLSNTDDAMWYLLAPTDETLKLLDDIFDIYDNLFDEYNNTIHSYAFHTQKGEMHFHKERAEFIVYFIFTKKAAHVILRKTLQWESYNTKIQECFSFKAGS